MAGRPRGIEDAVILRAAAELIGRVGPARLTLADVAGEVGLVPGTLVQRFGSKRGLLLALAAQSARDADEMLGRAQGGHCSALAALTAVITEPTAAMATPGTYANHLAFLCLDLTDPEFRQYALDIHQAQGRAIAALLDQARLTGELLATADVAALARSVQAVSSGAGLIWALDREGTLAARIRREVESVLSPHLPSHRTEPEES